MRDGGRTVSNSENRRLVGVADARTNGPARLPSTFSPVNIGRKWYISFHTPSDFSLESFGDRSRSIPQPVFSYPLLLFFSMYHMFPGEPDFRPYGISNPARATTTNNSVHTRRNHYDALVRRLGLDARIGLRLRLSRLAIGLPASAGRAARRCVLACRAIF